VKQISIKQARELYQGEAEWCPFSFIDGPSKSGQLTILGVFGNVVWAADVQNEWGGGYCVLRINDAQCFSDFVEAQ
jgi:hypothetical protein